MADGRSRELWNHTSAVLAMVANIHRDPKKGRPLRPADFHPLATPKGEPEPPQAPVSLLKTIFVDQRPAASE